MNISVETTALMAELNNAYLDLDTHARENEAVVRAYTETKQCIDYVRKYGFTDPVVDKIRACASSLNTIGLNTDKICQYKTVESLGSGVIGDAVRKFFAKVIEIVKKIMMWVRKIFGDIEPYCKKIEDRRDDISFNTIGTFINRDVMDDLIGLSNELQAHIQKHITANSIGKIKSHSKMSDIRGDTKVEKSSDPYYNYGHYVRYITQEYYGGLDDIARKYKDLIQLHVDEYEEPEVKQNGKVEELRYKSKLENYGNVIIFDTAKLSGARVCLEDAGYTTEYIIKLIESYRALPRRYTSIGTLLFNWGSSFMADRDAAAAESKNSTDDSLLRYYQLNNDVYNICAKIYGAVVKQIVGISRVLVEQQSQKTES